MELEVEDAKLRRMYADLMLENAAIKDILAYSRLGAATPAAHDGVADTLEIPRQERDTEVGVT